MAKPSDFLSHPYDSVFKKNETETVARNIMAILSRTGNDWRNLSWDEYKSIRFVDGNFTESEKKYFDLVVGYCVSEYDARAFSPNWESVK